MAVPNFNFDFSAFNPMVQALGRYMPQMLATKAREQEALSPLVPTAARMSLNRSLAEQDRAERESRAKISGDVAAQSLQQAMARRGMQKEDVALRKAEDTRRWALGGSADTEEPLPYWQAPATQVWNRTAGRASRYAAANIPIPTWDPIGLMAAAGSGGSAQQVAGENLRGTAAADKSGFGPGSCPPGYNLNPGGTCSPVPQAR